MKRETGICASNVKGIKLPRHATEPLRFQQANSSQRRTIFMLAFKYPASQVCSLVIGKGNDTISKPWIEIQSQPKRRSKWVQEAMDWIESRIEDSQFLSPNILDDYDDILRELSTIYLRQCQKDKMGDSLRTLELAMKVLKAKGLGKESALTHLNQTVIFNGQTAESKALFSRILSPSFGSPIPGGPPLDVSRITEKEPDAAEAEPEPEHGLDGVDVNSTEDNQQVE